MNETCDRCGPSVRAVYRAARTGELYLCLHCTSRLLRYNGGRWETIRYALDNNARTLRFCLIWLVVIVSPVVATVMTLLMRQML